jgi:hypothetical protein
MKGFQKLSRENYDRNKFLLFKLIGKEKSYIWSWRKQVEREA